MAAIDKEVLDILDSIPTDNILQKYDNYSYNIELCALPAEVLKEFDVDYSKCVMGMYGSSSAGEDAKKKTKPMLINTLKKNKVTIFSNFNTSEFSIDELKMTTYMGSTNTQGEDCVSQTCQMTMKVSEMYGCTFSQKMKLLAAMLGYSEGYVNMPLFLLITFTGYGYSTLTPVTDILARGNSSSTENGEQVIDPLIYRVIFGNVKTSLSEMVSGKTSYDIEMYDAGWQTFNSSAYLNINNMAPITIKARTSTNIFQAVGNQVFEHINNEYKKGFEKDTSIYDYIYKNNRPFDLIIKDTDNKIIYSSIPEIQQNIEVKQYLETDLTKSVIKEKDGTALIIYKDSQGNTVSQTGIKISDDDTVEKGVEEEGFWSKAADNTVEYSKRIGLGLWYSINLAADYINENQTDNAGNVIKNHRDSFIASEDNERKYNKNKTNMISIQTSGSGAGWYYGNADWEFKEPEGEDALSIWAHLLTTNWGHMNKEKSMPGIIKDVVPTYVGSYNGTCYYNLCLIVSLVEQSNLKTFLDINEHNDPYMVLGNKENQLEYYKNLYQNGMFIKNYKYLCNGTDTEVLSVKMKEDNTWFGATVGCEVNVSNGDPSFTEYNEFVNNVLKDVKPVQYPVSMTDLWDLTSDTDKIAALKTLKNIQFKPAGLQVTEQTNVEEYSTEVLKNMVGWNNWADSEFLQQITLEVIGDPTWLTIGINLNSNMLQRLRTTFPHILFDMTSFYNYNEYDEPVKDVLNSFRSPYMITQIESTFRDGRFSQQLTGFRPPLFGTTAEYDYIKKAQASQQTWDLFQGTAYNTSSMMSYPESQTMTCTKIEQYEEEKEATLEKK